MTERNFPKDTIIRCNRCGTKGPAPRAFQGVRENDKVWRMNQDMMIHPTCGHMDAHWVFNCDQ